MKDKINSVIKEIRAVVWPPRRRVYIDSLLVLIALAVGGVVIALIDEGLAKTLEIAINKTLGI